MKSDIRILCGVLIGVFEDPGRGCGMICGVRGGDEKRLSFIAWAEKQKQ